MRCPWLHKRYNFSSVKHRREKLCSWFWRGSFVRRILQRWKRSRSRNCGRYSFGSGKRKLKELCSRFCRHCRIYRVRQHGRGEGWADLRRRGRRCRCWFCRCRRGARGRAGRRRGIGGIRIDGHCGHAQHHRRGQCHGIGRLPVCRQGGSARPGRRRHRRGIRQHRAGVLWHSWRCTGIHQRCQLWRWHCGRAWRRHRAGQRGVHRHHRRDCPPFGLCGHRRRQCIGWCHARGWRRIGIGRNLVPVCGCCMGAGRCCGVGRYRQHRPGACWSAQGGWGCVGSHAAA